MKINRHLGVRFLAAVMIAISLSPGIFYTAHAQGMPPSDNIPSGQVIEGDRLLLGQNIVVDGNVTGDLFAIGSNVTINGEIGGSLYILAESVSINGKISGSTYQLAVNQTFDRNSYIGRNIYLVGLTLETRAGARANNDFFALCVNAWLSGEIGGHLRSLIGILNVDGMIGNGSEAEQVGNTLLRQTITLARFIGSEQTRPKPLSLLKPQAAETSAASPVLKSLIDYARKLLTLLFFGVMTVWLLPERLRVWKETARHKPFPSSGWGGLILIVAVIIVIVFTSIIPAIVILLWKATFWGLASFVLTFGYTALGLATITFITFTVYISKVIVSYLVGDLIIQRVSPHRKPHMFGALLLGAMLYMLLRFLPYVGWLIGLIVSLLGLGAIWLTQRESSKSEQKSETIQAATQFVEPPETGDEDTSSEKTPLENATSEETTPDDTISAATTSDE